MKASRNKNNQNSLMYRDPFPKNSWVFLTGGGGRTPMQKCLWTYHRIVRFRIDILKMSQFWFTCTWLLSRCGIFLFWGQGHTILVRYSSRCFFGKKKVLNGPPSLIWQKLFLRAGIGTMCTIKTGSKLLVDESTMSTKNSLSKGETRLLVFIHFRKPSGLRARFESF